jgi:hypothetical protein
LADIIRGQKVPRKSSEYSIFHVPETHFTRIMVASRYLGPADLPEFSDDDVSGRHNTKGKDGRHVEAILRSFNFEKSVAWDALTHHFSSGVRHRELCSVALVLSHCFGFTTISRDARRSYPVLIKWFHDNWAIIEPVLPFVALRDATDRIIDHHRNPAK